MHLFISVWGCIQGRIVPKFYFGFPGAFHHTVLSYHGRQVSEACNIMTTYGIKDSLVRAITAKDRNCVSLAAVLFPVHNQEESGPVVMYCFFGLLPDLGKIAYVRAGGWR